MRSTILAFTLAFITTTCFSQQLNIIPQPVSVVTKPGKFTITQKTTIVASDDEDRKTAILLNDYLQQVYGFKLDIDKKEGKNYIRFSTKRFIKAPDNDAYSLTVSPDGITINGDTYNGTFYGMETLIQLLPVEKVSPMAIPMVTINDYPRFAYRGMHLDVGRHFFPVSFVKKYIDYLALHKMNYFHWHLTEDQGWRIEIKKYPRLTEVGAYRNGTIIGRYPGTANDNQPYGGFYTQDEVKDIVQYAADRHITVIPEIEMPGHASAAIAAYPGLSCFPNEKTIIPSHPSEASQRATGKLVQESWGVYEDVFCAGKDSTFQFLQNVLDEVIPLFPCKYVHVGGDECPKANWKRCPLCQKRIQEEHLKDEHALQSYFIQRMEKYLNSKGKTLIGWDEILEGGLAPNAVVMSWRGEEGGIAAAKDNHQVIMTPGEYVYLDHAQSQNEDSVTIGGYLPLEKTYSYEPIPAALPASQAKYVMGAQGNVWTEYMAYPSKVEYMIFPRMSALSEVLWSPKEKKNWADFERRLPVLFKRYNLWKANYSDAYYNLKTSILPAPGNNGLQLKLETKDKNGKLTYGIADQHLQKNYTKPVVLTQSGLITAMYQNKNNITDTVSLDLHFNKATGKKIMLKTDASSKYPGDGPFTLVNGIQNTTGLSKGKEFLAWQGGDCEAMIDLGKIQSFSNATIHTLQQEGSWIYAPQSAEVFISNDGKSFTSVGSTTGFTKSTGSNGVMKVDFNTVQSRYIKVLVKNTGIIPDGKPGSGNPAWLFVDEIEIM